MFQASRLVTLMTAVFLIACLPDQKLTGQCELGDPIAAAQLAAGESDDGSIVMLNGRRIRPLGTELPTGTFSTGASLSSTGVLAVVSNGKEDNTLVERTGRADITSDWQSIDFFDAAGARHLYTLPIQSSFIGVRWHPSAATVYAAGGGRDIIRRIAWDPSNPTTPATELEPLDAFGYPTGLALNKAGDTIYATLLHRHQVVALDVATGTEKARYTVEAAPYQVELSPDETRAYVSNWSSNTVSVIDLKTGATLEHVIVGKNPEGIAVAPDGKRVYVGVSDEDTIGVIDTRSLAVSHFDLRATEQDPVGISPTDVRLSPDGNRLYIIAASENAVIVLDPATGERIGAIPTALYPTEIEPSPDGKRLYVVNAKGHGAGPNTSKEFVASIVHGTAQFMDTPDDARLAELDEDVHRFNNIMANIYDPECQGVKHPVPMVVGQPSPVIKHVVYIMRENKTYDSLLGDLGPEADGDPSLAVFGEDITPNLHALARRFGNLTNFYNESEQSVQGHIWGSSGYVNDFSEKTWIAFWGRPGEAQVMVPGMEPASAPRHGDIFQHLLNHGVGVRNYGEYLGVVLDAQSTTSDVTNLQFPGYFGVDDVRKVDVFIKELEAGRLEPFTFLLLGNDHTRGLTTGAPTPEYMVGENDEATGKAVEAISNSPFWKNTVIFIFEDDPQGNADHIDAHRSINIVVSPWVKRGAISRVTYSFPSLHKTMSLILGVPLFSRHLAVAAGIYDVFDTEPGNSEPYARIPNPVPYKTNPSPEKVEKTDPELAELIRESNAMDLTTYDMAPGLGRLLWKYRMGDRPFPEHLATPVDYEEEDDD